MAQLQVTIDDGPQPVRGGLDSILVELSRRGVVAAFFVLGQEVAADPGAAGSIIRQGHVLGNHSWDHLEPATPGYTNDQIYSQFQRTHDQVKLVTFQTMRHWRAPRLQEIPRLSGIIRQGPTPLYTLSHCDVNADSKDSQGQDDAAGMLRSIRSDIARGGNRSMFRLLFHVQATTAAALRPVLDGLVSDGHTLVNFSQES